jgi:hypothetical protein
MNRPALITIAGCIPPGSARSIAMQSVTVWMVAQGNPARAIKSLPHSPVNVSQTQSNPVKPPSG